MLEQLIDRDGGFAFGEARYPRGGAYGPLRRRYAMVLVLHEGEAEISCDGLSHPLRAGCSALIRNKTTLEIRYPAGVTTMVSWCEASPSEETGSAAHVLREPAIVETSARIEALQRAGLDLADAGAGAETDLRDALGQAVFAAVLLDARQAMPAATPPPRIALARDLLRDGFREPWTVAGLAARCNLTREHLTVGFRRHFGTTPSRYLWRLRAAAGRRLLIETAWSLDAIAVECGYKSPFHFSRQIKSVYGTSPSEIRTLRGYRLPSDVAECARITVF